MPKFYNVPITGTTNPEPEPDTKGPYPNFIRCLSAAKSFRKTQAKGDLLLWLRIDDNGEPFISSYTTGELE